MNLRRLLARATAAAVATAAVLAATPAYAAAPAAVADNFYRASGDYIVRLPVLANDAGGSGLRVSDWGTPQYGVVDCMGECVYVPNDETHETDSWTYAITDDSGLTSTAKVTTHLSASPATFDAVDDTASTPWNAGVTVDIRGNDIWTGGVWTLTGNKAPAWGSVSCDGKEGTCTWTPGSGKPTVTAVSFDYTIYDGNAVYDTGRVTITLNRVAADLQLTQVPSPVTAWNKVTVLGTLKTAAGAPIAGEQVELMMTTPDSAGNQAATSAGPCALGGTGCATATSSATGALRWTFTPIENLSLHAQALDTSAYAIADSSTVAQQVRARVTAATNRRWVRPGAAFSIRGDSVLIDVPRTYDLQRYTGSAWATVPGKVARSSADSAWAVEFALNAPATPGDYKYRLHFAGDAHNAEASSPIVTVTVYKLAVTTVHSGAPEYARVANKGSSTVDLKGWRVRNRAGRSVALPTYHLAPGASVLVYTGSGTTGSGRIYLKTTDLWRASDTATLLDPYGVSAASLLF